MTTTEAASIIVVDDQPANLKLLEDMLKVSGYRIRSFPRGRLALAAAAQNPPDLFLLDINMPEMNGYEVCKRLKSNPELSAAPVIFLSAQRTRRQDQGFSNWRSRLHNQAVPVRRGAGPYPDASQTP